MFDPKTPLQQTVDWKLKNKGFMKLVLLPGMDGTGALFRPFLSCLSRTNALIIELPQVGEQDYSTLSEHVLQRLPCEDFILVAESFSGGIAAKLLNMNIEHLKGVIFVASFLSSPRPRLARLASFLPVGFLARLPLANYFIRLFFFGTKVNQENLREFKRALKSINNSVLMRRLRQIAELKYAGFSSNVPVVHISATEDKLVPAEKVQDFEQAFPKITYLEIEGPHFILQAEPENGSIVINKAVGSIEKYLMGPGSLN